MTSYLKWVLIIFLFSSCAFEDPYFITIITSHGDRIIIDGKFAIVEEIPFAIAFKTKDYDSLRKSKFYIKLKVTDGTKMEVIQKIKRELRKAKIENIRYYEIEEKEPGYINENSHTKSFKSECYD